MRSKPLIGIAFAATALSCGLFGTKVAGERAKLDGEETRARAAIAARFEPEAIPFLRRTVEQVSGTHDREGVLAVAALYEPRLAALGFSTSRIDLAAVGRGCHVVAERRAARADAPRILLLGHLDTVFERDSRFTGFYRGADGRIQGPGVSDMKGGNLVLLEALEALAKVSALDRLDRLDLTVVLTGDEEDPGPDADGSFRTTRGPVVALASRADVVLAFEPMNATSPRPIVARRGYATWSVEVEAKSAHSSLVSTKAVGPGAIVPLARIVDRLHRELRTVDRVSFNVGNVAGGTDVTREPGSEAQEARVSGKLNIVPRTAHAHGDLRTASADQLRAVAATMAKIVEAEAAAFDAENDPEARITARFTLKDEYPAMAETKGNHELLARLSTVSQDLGGPALEAADPITQGAGDVAFVAAGAAAALDGLGPIGFDYHTPREATDVASLRTATERTAVLLLRLARSAPRRPR